MGYARSRFSTQMTAVIAVAAAVVAVVLVIFGALFSGCDVRYRSQKAACRGGDVEQCLAVAKIYDDKGDALLADVLHYGDATREYYKRACDLGSPVGCAGFAKHSYDDSEAGARIHAHTTACAGGIAASCVELGDAYATGQDVPRDDARALTLYLSGCTAKDGKACEDAAIMRAMGRGAAHDDGVALDLDKQGCAAGDKNACVEVEWYAAHHEFRWQSERKQPH